MGHSSSHHGDNVSRGRHEDPRITSIRYKLQTNIAEWLSSFLQYRNGNKPFEGSVAIMPRITEVSIPDFSHGLANMTDQEIGTHIMSQKPHDDLTLRLRNATNHADWTKRLGVTNLVVTAHHSRDVFELVITYDIYLLDDSAPAAAAGNVSTVHLDSNPVNRAVSDDSSDSDSSGDSSDSDTSDDSSHLRAREAARAQRNSSRASRQATWGERYAAREERNRRRSEYARQARLANVQGMSPVPSEDPVLPAKKTILVADEEVIRKPSMVLENRPALVDLTCKVCFEKRCNVVMHPCGHIAACSDCIKSNNFKCPVCRVQIKSMTQIFVS